MFERNLISELREWAAKPGHKPLVLRGARQVGKSTLVDRFGQEYDVYLKLNLELSAHSDLFRHGRSVHEIMPLIYYLNRKERIPGKTLLFIDEIQSCPEAVAALRYFHEEMPDIDVIAAGSLLESLIDKHISFPVGRVEYKAVRPCSFLEYLEATGQKSIKKALASGEDLSGIHNSIESEFKTFSLIGGMPEAVDTFVRYQDFNRVRRVHERLLNDYRDDFGKHAPKELIPRIEMIWDSIPAQLSKENKKFIFSAVHKNLRAKDLEMSMRWLLDAGLILHTVRVTKPALPIDAYRDNFFKVFFLDVGLLAAKAKLNARTLLEGNRIFQEFKGALAEQYVQQQLLAECGLETYYWASEKSGSEIDFLIQNEMSIVPIEVKAEVNLQAKSLKFYCLKFRPPVAIRISMGKYYKQTISFSETSDVHASGSYTLIDLPLYAVSRIQQECAMISDK